ncbi:hypothetical protein ElyMa_004481800 [Elysia marginata]|uniref:Uncharacterized protein n=1 Tax=Elysia marginata TaxID=1093978 RepID=A0AAV4HKK5_9GAST|nr:hypothetical protein ElyMa_004481800 [Elysia marginata]
MAKPNASSKLPSPTRVSSLIVNYESESGHIKSVFPSKDYRAQGPEKGAALLHKSMALAAPLNPWQPQFEDLVLNPGFQDDHGGEYFKRDSSRCEG